MIKSIPIATIKKKEYEDYINKEKLPLLRLDSTYLLNIKAYNYIIQQLRRNGTDISSIEELGRLKKGQERKNGKKTYGIMVKSIAKLTIHPLKLELKYVSGSSFVKPCDIAIISTGIGSIGRAGIIPQFLVNDLIKEFFDENLPVAVTQHIIKLTLERKDVSPYYIVTLLNSFYGRLLIEGIATYGATGQLEVHTSILSKLKVPIVNIHDKIAEKVEKALEDYEARAWKAYFKAMKIVEEYLKVEDIGLTSTSTLKIMKNVGRIDAAMHILLNGIASKLGEENIYYISEFYDIISGTAPSSRKYEEPCKGQKYISTKSVDESGYIDDENFYCYPGQLKTRNLAKKGSLVILKNAHAVEALGKVGVIYPYDSVPVISDLYILSLKPSIDEDISFYINALSKTKLFKQMMQLLAYGLTAHIKAEDLAKIPIPFIEQWKEVAKYMKEFFENKYHADVLKRQAIMELENQILKLLG